MTQRGLSNQQQLALQILLTGQTVAEAAETANINRSTIYRWIREDYEFQAALNRGRREIQLAAPNLIASIIEPAIQIVRAAIARGDVRAALAVLKSAGLGSRPSLTASDEDPEHLRKMAELDTMKRTLVENGIDWDDYVKSLVK